MLSVVLMLSQVRWAYDCRLVETLTRSGSEAEKEEKHLRGVRREQEENLRQRLYTPLLCSSASGWIKTWAQERIC